MLGSGRLKKAREVKSKFKSMHIIFFDIKGIVQAKHSIPHTTVTYGDCVKMCEDFTPNFHDKRTGCCITTMHRLTLLLPPVNFLPKTI
jgi:hypothetical protein